jgi:RNA polymerase sigma factor (sigma-70 family)
MTSASDADSEDREDLTSYHVNRALRGDRDSLGWVVTRLSPFLKAQAAWRLGPLLRTQDAVDDVVAEAWLIALRRIGDIVHDHGRSTPRLLTFLGTTILNITNRRIDDRLRRRMHPSPRACVGGDALDGLADTVTGVVTNAANDEASAAVEAALAGLAPGDREIIVLRIVEGFSNQEAAAQLGEAPNTISHRYQRALERLRKALPESFFADFAPE